MDLRVFDKPLIPIPHADLVFERAAQYGLERSDLLAKAGLEGEINTQTKLSLKQVGIVLSQVLKHSDSLGYELGLATALTSHGFLGLGLMCQATGQEAINFGLRYANLAAPHMQLSQLANKKGVIQITPSVHLGGLEQPLIDYYLVALWRIATQLLADVEQPSLELFFECVEPDYYAAYKEQLPPVHFNAGVNQLRGLDDCLAKPLVSANPVSAELIAQQCERQLGQLGLEPTGIVQRVRAEIYAPVMGYNDLPTVAELLDLSPRSLKRKLQSQGESFRSLLDAIRLDDAKALLRNSTLSIAVISERLGYSDPVNFSRAFRRLMEVSPSDYRNS